MAELIWRLRSGGNGPRVGVFRGDFGFILVAGGAAAFLVAAAVMASVQVATAFTLVALVIALHQYNRQWGIIAVFAFWLIAPGLRRVLGLMTGYLESDPLSLAPFLATSAVAGLELLRFHVPTVIRRILLAAAGGFALGLPVGLVAGTSSGMYAFVAYLAGVSAAVLGVGERTSARDSTLRKVLLYGIPPVAAYAVYQHVVGLPAWDKEWVAASQFGSIGISEGEPIRSFASLNSPGTLASLLGLSLLMFLTVHRLRWPAALALVIICVASSLTFVRSAWLGLIVAGLAHVIASRGASARVVFGTVVVIVMTAVALSPVSSTAHNVVDRFKTVKNLGQDTSATERQATFSDTLPIAARAPIGHGLGSAGEATKLKGESLLRAPDNGYLALMYQVGPVGFLIVVAALGYILIAAWNGARARAPGQDLRLVLFASFVFLLVTLAAGDEFYGSHGVVLWFIVGQVLAYDFRRRAQAEASSRSAAMASS
jgi:putative inorganic carbon (hco3(-)) transporter